MGTNALANGTSWYARPAFFVTDVNQAARFYIEQLGCTRAWPAGEGEGPVCQVNHGDCELILCQDPRQDRGRLFIELLPEQYVALRRELAERGVEIKETWWGYDTVEVDDPDGNQLFFGDPR